MSPRRRYQRGHLLIRGKTGQKVWVARFREDVLRPDGTAGRVLRSTVLGSLDEIGDRDKARKQLDKKLRPINQGRQRAQSTMTFAAFVAEHFEPGLLPTFKPATRQIYSTLLRKHLLPRFGRERLYDVDRAEVQRFVIDKLAAGLSWETASHLRHLLSRVLRCAVEWGLLSENAARGVRMPERTTKRPHTFLSAEQLRRLLNELREPARTIALVAALAGLRIGEILAIRWGRVDLERGTLRVEESCYRGIFGTPKTRASRREVPLAQVVLDALLVHGSRSKNRSADALVFATRSGAPLAADNLRKRDLLPASARAGLRRIDWHTLRHTHTTLLHALGVPLKVAQAQLGHSRLATTLEIYTHATSDAQRDAVGRLERVLFPNCSQPGSADPGTELIQ